MQSCLLLLIVIAFTSQQVFGDHDPELKLKYEIVVKENKQLQNLVSELQKQMNQSKKTATDLLEVVQSREAYIRAALVEERLDHKKQIDACGSGLDRCQTSLRQCEQSDINKRCPSDVTDAEETIKHQISLRDCNAQRDELMRKVAELENKLKNQAFYNADRDELAKRVTELEQKLQNHNSFSTQSEDLALKMAKFEEKLRSQISSTAQSGDLGYKLAELEQRIQDKTDSRVKCKEMEDKIVALEQQVQNTSSKQCDELTHKLAELQEKMETQTSSSDLGRQIAELNQKIQNQPSSNALTEKVSELEKKLQNQISLSVEHNELTRKVTQLEINLQNQISTRSQSSDTLMQKVTALASQLQNQRVGNETVTSQQLALQNNVLNIVQLGGRKYLFETKQLATWFEALGFCNLVGMNLLSIETQQENDLIITQLRNLGSDKEFVFTSGNKVGGTNMAWSSGALLTFSAWAPGQPDLFKIEHCLALIHSQWHDLACGIRAKFVCEQR